MLLLHPPGDDYPPPLPTMTVDWQRDFGFPAGSTCAVRDIFAGASLGEFRGNWTATVNDSFALVAVHGCSGDR